MKKSLLLILLLLMCMCLALVSCNKDKPGTIPTETDTETAAPSEITSGKETTTPENESHVHEDSPPTEGLLFELNEDGESYSVVGYVGTATEVIIPAVYEGKPVLSIGEVAFWGTGLTSVAIPDGVISIGGWAFSDCTNLTSIVIPNSVTSIGVALFPNCANLVSITVAKDNAVYHSVDNCLIETETGTLIAGCKSSIIPDNVKHIGDQAFIGCTGLTSVAIPDGVISIGGWAFSDCTNLTSIVIPNSVTSIESGVFCGCESLTEIFIPDSVTTISESAFADCKSLTEITIPESLLYIGESAFYECIALTDIVLPESLLCIGEQAFFGCTGLTSITIPDSVTDISWGAFCGCTGLTCINLGKGIVNMGDFVFQDCTGLTCINLGKGIVNMGDFVFQDCTSLTSINWGDDLVNIGRYAFTGCIGLTELHFGETLMSIGEGAFSGCTGLTEIVFPNSLTSIGYSAFSDCTGLKSIFIPKGVTDLGSFAFSRCSNVTSIIVEDGNPIYHSSENCLIETECKMLLLGCACSTIPTDGSVTSIGRYAFSGCIGLEELTIPNCVTTIEWNAFNNCTNLVSIVIPEGVTAIDYGLFTGCTNLASVTIPESVLSVYHSAFRGCDSLTDVYYTGTEEDWSVVRIKDENDALLAATIHCAPYSAENPAWSKGLSFDSNGDGTCSVTGIGECSDTIIVIPKISPDGDMVTSIDYRAFLACESIISVSIPNTVECIWGEAFADCINLSSVSMGYGVKNIEFLAFSGCENLSKVTLPNSIEYLGDDIFYGCSSLTSIYIPTYVQKIGEAAFAECWALTDITVSKQNQYYDVIDNCLIDVSNGILIFGNQNSAIPYGVTRIGAYALYGNKSLIDVAIPDSVTSIGEYAFAGCSALTSIIIPDSVTDVGRFAFDGCTSLTSVSIPVCCAHLIDSQPTLTTVYYGGTIKEWIENNGGYPGAHCSIHCSDGDISAEVGMATRAYRDPAISYVHLGDWSKGYLMDVELLAEYKAAYDVYLNTGINYEEYVVYSDAEEGTPEYDLYLEYLAFRTTRSRYTTTVNRRLNDIVNMYKYLREIKDGNVEIKTSMENFQTVYLPLLLEIFECELIYEDGKEGDLTAIMNKDELPSQLIQRLDLHIRVSQGDYPTTIEEAQSLYNAAVAAVVDPGYITEEEIAERIGLRFSTAQ